MNKPFFSVICPLFNAETFLAEAANSIIAQTLTNWELILVDDGSTDNSLNIVNNWAEKDARIRVLQHLNGANKGVSASRNLGIKQAKGEWIAFLDADDVWLPDKLEKQHKIIQQLSDKNLVLVYSQAKVIDADGNFIELKDQEKEHNPIHAIYGSGKPGFQENAFKWAIKSVFEAPTSSVVSKKELLVDLNGFEEDMRFSEDALLWYRIIEKGNIYFIDSPLIKYRVHPTQWNAEATIKLKLTRRFIVYERLLSKTEKMHIAFVSYLLAYKGFRIIVRSNIGYPFLDFKLILKYWKKLIRNKNVLLFHKLCSFIVPFSEFILLPLRIFRAKVT